MIRDYADLYAHSETTGTATASAGLAGVTQRTNYLTGVHASFSVAGIGTLRIRSGTSDIAVFRVHNQRDIVFNPPLRFPPAAAAGAVFDLGVSGTISNVVLEGFAV